MRSDPALPIIPIHMATPTHHLAQINVARMRAPLTDELMAGFVAELAPVNALADRSPGFVWRLQNEGSDATSIRVFPDDMILVNISVWESLDALKAFVYHSHHTDVLRQREQWFERMQGFYAALWWLPAGEIPSALDGKARLDYLLAHGESPFAFTFKKPFFPPV